MTLASDTEAHPRLFGTDGVRGCANHYPMTVETALALGRAVGKVFRREDGKRRVVIGKDTRLSCYMFENALISGLCSMGIDTLMCGPLPTPGVAYITRAYRADAGIVISASHNPYYDNGIKFFSPAGFKLPDAVEREIERVVATQEYEQVLPADDALGKNTKIDDAMGRYIEFVKSSFPRQGNLQGMQLVVDCAHGATYRVGPLVFEELGATVHAYGNHPNGLNINDKCGALYPGMVSEKVLVHGADVGIAFDGDGDRVMMVDEMGQLVEGDAILAICAKNMKDHGELEQNLVVGTVMTNLGIVQALEGVGIEVVLSPVGDRNVLREMLHHGAIVGGEQSGHLIFLRHNTTGDGLVSALQVLAIMKEKSLPLSELVSWVQRYPQILLNVEIGSKPPLETLPKIQKVIGGAQKALGKRGRVVVRYSGTENICRVMVEGKSEEEIRQWADQIAEVVRGELGS